MKRQKELKQYFTPPEVAEFMVRNSTLGSPAKVIDPAVGEGVFLEALLRHGCQELWGIDLDQDILRQNRNRFRGKAGVHLFHGNALRLQDFPELKSNSFDLAIGNPPFSNQKNKVEDYSILQHFFLRGARQSVEILFLERFIQLVKPGGLIRIILPINIFSNSNLQYVRNFIISNLQIEAVVSLPRNIFRYTSAKTAILFGKKAVMLPGSLLGAQSYAVKLITIAHKRDVSALPQLTIRGDQTGVWKELDEIQFRMDPDYHEAKARVSVYLDSPKYPFKTLSQLASIHNGFTKYGEHLKKIYPRADARKNGTYIRLIKAKNISATGFVFEPKSFFIRKDEDLYKRQACAKRGDVLVVRVGVGCAGRTACVIQDRYLGQVDDWIFILRTQLLDPAFLCFYLNSSIGQEFMKMEKQGTGTVSISKSKLGNIPVPMLSKKAQSEFQEGVVKMYTANSSGNASLSRKIFKELDTKLENLLRREG